MASLKNFLGPDGQGFYLGTLSHTPYFSLAFQGCFYKQLLGCWALVSRPGLSQDRWELAAGAHTATSTAETECSLGPVSEMSKAEVELLASNRSPSLDL